MEHCLRQKWFVALLFMDLSKAFDWLLYDLLLSYQNDTLMAHPHQHVNYYSLICVGEISGLKSQHPHIPGLHFQKWYHRARCCLLFLWIGYFRSLTSVNCITMWVTTSKTHHVMIYWSIGGSLNLKHGSRNPVDWFIKMVCRPTQTKSLLCDNLPHQWESMSLNYAMAPSLYSRLL